MSSSCPLFESSLILDGRTDRRTDGRIRGHPSHCAQLLLTRIMVLLLVVQWLSALAPCILASLLSLASPRLSPAPLPSPSQPAASQPRKRRKRHASKAAHLRKPHRRLDSSPAAAAASDQPPSPLVAAAMSKRPRKGQEESAAGSNKKAKGQHKQLRATSEEELATAAATAAAAAVAGATPLAPLAASVAPPPPPPCHLYKLPRDLLLHVMRFDSAPVPSLLRVARCSSRLMRDRRQPAAWQGAPPFVLRTSSLGSLEFLSLLGSSRSPLHHAPIHLVWSRERPWGRTDIDAVLSVPHLHTLGAFQQRSLTVEQWKEMLPHPSFQRLQVLHAGNFMRPLDSKCMQLIGHLPQLRTFSWSDAAPSVNLSGLAAAPALTYVSSHPGVHTLQSIQSLTACAHLRRLRLVKAPLEGSAFANFFAHPNMAQLEHVVLDQFTVTQLESVPTADLAASCAALQSLHTLELKEVGHVDLLLPHLALCKQLRMLRIQVASRWNVRDDAWHSCFPSADLLRALLVASPELRVELQVGTQYLFTQYMYDHPPHWALSRVEQTRLDAAGAAWVAASGELQQLPAERVKLFMDKSNIMQTGS